MFLKYNNLTFQFEYISYFLFLRTKNSYKILKIYVENSIIFKEIRYIYIYIRVFKFYMKNSILETKNKNYIQMKLYWITKFSTVTF